MSHRPLREQRRSSIGAFLLFAAALFAVGPAEASRTATDASSSLASSSSRDLASLELSLLEPLASVDTTPRLGFGFAEDLGLLDPERRPGGFVVFAAEAAQCALTYARNNPLKYVDPDGRATHPVTGGSGIPYETVRTNRANLRVGFYGFVRNGGTKFHHGVDLKASIGTPLVAPISGTVSVTRGPVGGLSVAVEGADGTRIGMSHLSSSLVKSGDRILEGMAIATSGNSGNAGGLTATGEDHAHLGVKIGGSEADPIPYFGQNPSSIQPMVVNGLGLGVGTSGYSLSGVTLLPQQPEASCGASALVGK